MKIIEHLKHVQKFEVSPNLITQGLLQPGPPGDTPGCAQGHTLYLGHSINGAFLVLRSVSPPTTASPILLCGLFSCVPRGANSRTRSVCGAGWRRELLACCVGAKSAPDLLNCFSFLLCALGLGALGWRTEAEETYSLSITGARYQENSWILRGQFSSSFFTLWAPVFREGEGES